MKKLLLAALMVIIIIAPAMAADGVINVQSSFNVQKTADRLESILNEKGMTIFMRIKHSESAGKVGIDMIAGPSEILVIADKDNNPDWIALDLLSQAEHDEKPSSGQLAIAVGPLCPLNNCLRQLGTPRLMLRVCPKVQIWVLAVEIR